jgi:hypothetical protein
MDIVSSNCLSLGGYRYTLVLVDAVAVYCWVYGMPSVSPPIVVARPEAFRSDAGGVSHKFHSDFNKKLIVSATFRWIRVANSCIIIANTGR